ncbi:MAG: hypothetical protein ACMUJM_22530 [bacterium]
MYRKIFSASLVCCLCFCLIKIGRGLAAPEINISVEDEKIMVNRPFRVTIDVNWEGGPYDYLIPAPLLNLPDNVELIDSHTNTRALSGEGIQIIFLYHLKARIIGTYTLDSIEVKYIPKEEKEGFSKMLPAVSIQVVPWNLCGLTYIWLMIIFGIVILIVCVFFFFRAQRRRLAREKSKEEEKKEIGKHIIALLEEARQAKVKGEDRLFVEAIIKLKKTVSWNSKEESTLLERIKYSGHKISKEDREYMYRDIEHALKKEENLKLC